MRCPHCGLFFAELDGSAPQALENTLKWRRKFRRTGRFPKGDRPGPMHAANRIEFLRAMGANVGLDQIEKLALKQVQRYWTEYPWLREHYAGLGTFVGRVGRELNRREEEANCCG